jgi:hypothetical protein
MDFQEIGSSRYCTSDGSVCRLLEDRVASMEEHCVIPPPYENPLEIQASRSFWLKVPLRLKCIPSSFLIVECVNVTQRERTRFSPT